MNVTVENLAPCKKLLRVDVDAQAVDSAFEAAMAEFQRHARLPGFRDGKAPRHLIVKVYARDIEADVKRKLISDSYRQAVQEQKLRIIGAPEIEEIQFGRGQALQFAATVETAPEFELPEYKGLPVRLEARAVTEADVERALDVLRADRASFQDVARPVQSGDFVVVNYSGTCEGRPISDLTPTARSLTEQKQFWMHVQRDTLVPGFTDQLVGAQAGEKRTVTVDFPADFVTPQLAGKQGVYDVEIVQVKERVLPELNDEFARAFEAENVEKLREGVERDLENELRYKQGSQLRNQLVRGLLERVQCELPESVVMNETRHVIYDIVRENQQRGVTRETIDKQKDEIYSYASRSAKERVKAAFLLHRIAEKEGIGATQEEISGRIVALAQQYQMKPEKMLRQLRERNGIGEIEEQIITNKVLDFLQLHAHIEEAPPRPGSGA
ncbi:MAG: trigger factor [Verrucomicrobia bacterium]|nr:trigger factor [Verrucomicrobiota bacterium]